jgi:hypothetical protein
MRDKKLPLEIEPQDVLAIMDELAVMEVYWQDGQCLPQTVFTCLYLHSTPAAVAAATPAAAAPAAGGTNAAGAPETAKSESKGADKDGPLGLAHPELLPVLLRFPLLRVWCLCYLKRIWQLREMIHRADIYEEDDFNGYA